MMRLLLKKQGRVSLGLTLLLLVLAILQNAFSSFSNRYESAQRTYVEGADTAHPSVFFAQLETDREQADRVVTAIQNYEEYTQEKPQGEVDLLEVAAGNAGYADYEMLTWREEMLRMPGKYTETVMDDMLMLDELSQRFNNQAHLTEDVANTTELLQRGLRRLDSQAPVYRAALSEYTCISPAATVRDPVKIDRLFSYMRGDCAMFLSVILSAFSVFSYTAQQRVSDTVLVSRMGMRKFSLYKIVSSEIATVLGLLVYYAGLSLVFSNGKVGEMPWDLPIQAINGYETVAFAWSAGQYFLWSVGWRTGYALLTLNITLFLSILSKNTGISTLLCLGYGGLAVGLFYAAGDKTWGSLLIGSGQALVDDLPFVAVGETVISYIGIGIGVLVLLLVVFQVTTIRISRGIARKRVK